jgi:ubiquitin-like-conjugating enzyme ATG3
MRTVPHSPLNIFSRTYPLITTITIEPFILSTSLQAASVHPCKHASVMKKVIERMNLSVVAKQLAHQQKAEESTKEGKKK